MSKKEKTILKAIAYCAEGMMQDESEGNYGLANDWKIRLRLHIEEYDEFRWGDKKKCSELKNQTGNSEPHP